MARRHSYSGRSATDSIYGAVPSLSSAPSSAHPFLSPNIHFSTQAPLRNMGVGVPIPTFTTQFSTIDHLVLLDLLDTPHPLVRTHFPNTARLFDVLVSAGTRLRDSGILDFHQIRVTSFPSRALQLPSWFGYSDWLLVSCIGRSDGVRSPNVVCMEPHLSGNNNGFSSKSIWGCALNQPSVTHPSAPVRKPDSELVRFLHRV